VGYKGCPGRDCHARPADGKQSGTRHSGTRKFSMPASMIPFDDRDGFIWYDGRLVAWRDARLHVLTHGLHYASCVFEGERAYDGKVFHLEDHNARLLNSAKILGFEVPASMDDLARATAEVLRANRIVEGYVRPVAWRGAEQMGVSAQASRIHLAIAAWDWPAYFSPEARQKGIRMRWAPWKRPAPDTAPVHAKAAGLYMICTMSKHIAEAEGCTGANIFLVMNGELHTPTPDCFLNGITRQTVIALAKKRGITVVERAILPQELGKAEEVFLTGSAAEVTPVGEIIGEYGHYRFTPGAICRLMWEDYDRAVGKKAAATAAA
jgi:branched-chain amino acid aminotransferase